MTVYTDLDLDGVWFQATEDAPIEFELGVRMHHALQIRRLNITFDALDGYTAVDRRSPTCRIQDIDGLLSQPSDHGGVHTHAGTLFERPGSAALGLGIHQGRCAGRMKLGLVDLHCRIGYLQVRDWGLGL